MRARVTLQLPRGAGQAARLQGASILLLGEGYVAKALRPELEARGASVTASSRAGAMSLHSPALREAFASASHVVVSIPPGRDGDPALQALASVGTNAAWIGYLSATSVYGDRKGGWAFEGEAPTPGIARGVRRADAEIAWLETFAQTHLFRLAGIYGPTISGVARSPFAKLRNGTARVVQSPGHIVNRIHVDDIVSALLASMQAPCPGDIYNIADGHPAPPGDVLDHAAALLGLPPPPRVDLYDASVSDMARSFYADSKRVDITRAKARLGWEPRYCDYKSGLKSLLG